MLLSIVMIAKNEELNMERCLKSFQHILNKVDGEIIVMDTGSEDKTIEISKKYTPKVYSKAWTNHFGNMRNESIKYARGEWLFVVDVDEEMIDDEAIIDFFRTGKYKQFKSASILRTDVNGEIELGTIELVRLFENNIEFKYIGAIHEQPEYRKPLCQLKSILKHYGYERNDKELIERKGNQYKEILEKEISKNPTYYYNWFQLSQTYCYLEDFSNGLKAILKAKELVDEINKDEHAVLMVCIHLIKNYFWCERYLEVIETVKKIESLSDKYIDIYYFAGKACIELEDEINTVLFYEKYIELITTGSYNPNTMINSETSSEQVVENVCSTLSIIYLKNGEKKNLLRILNLIKSEKILVKSVNIILTSFIAEKNYLELIKFFQEKINLSSDETIKLYEESFIKLVDKMNINELEILKLEIDKIHDRKLLSLRTRFYESYKKTENSNKELAKLKNEIKSQIQLLISNGEFASAEKVISTYMDIDDKDIEIYTYRLMIFILNRQFEEAINMLELGLTIDSEYIDLLYNGGYLYEQLGNPLKAVEYYRKILSLTKEDELIIEITTIIKKLGIKLP